LLSVNGRFIHLTNNISQRGKDYNRRIKQNTRSFRFPYESACYMHSASISEDYLILTEIPFHFNTFNALWTSLSGGAMTDMFKWNGETMPTYFRIISLDTGEQVARIPGPAFFQFHHINSYQNKDNQKKITVDICAYDDPRIINELYLDKLRENIFPSGAGYVRRFEIDLDANTCIEPNTNAREPKGNHQYSHAHSLVPVQFELPRINPKFITKLYRYIYAVRAPPGRLFDALIKLDIETKQQVAIWEESCTSPSEPIFVPRPDAKDDQEDDGIVLSVILDQKAKRSFLLVLDGSTLKELGRAYLPVHIPLSIHGNFY
jgi:beta,beta-carotene 9',10'-dioxygenase